VGKLTTVLVSLVALGVGASSATALRTGRVCGYVHASVPYSRHGTADRWRVYAAGATSCHSAEEALSAVMHLRGTVHEGRDEAHSYMTYGDWHCPFGHMGYQQCEIPSRAPFQAEALAVECAENGCPSRRPPSYFP
jgi:hypothetical protein